MKKKDKKNIENIKSEDFNTSSPADVSEPDVTPKKNRFYTQTWFIVVIASLAIIAVLGILIGVSLGVYGYTLKELFGMPNDNFDYLTDSLDPYIEINESDYKNYNIEIDLKKPSNVDLEAKITELLAANRGKDKLYDGTMQTLKPIKAGDEAYIYYVGYIFEDGRRINIADKNNLDDSTPESLVIGTKKDIFGIGFETALLGKTATGTFGELWDRGNVNKEKGDIIYATMSYVLDNGLAYYDVSVCIDTSDESIEKYWGEGFFDVLSGAKIGGARLLKDEDVPSFYLKDSDKRITYTDIRIDYVIRPNSNSVSPVTVESYFPKNHEDESLRGKTVYFDVYIDHTICYDTKEFNEDFILNTLKITPETLSSYSGDNTVEKCKSYYMDILMQEYEEEKENLAKKAIWERLYELVEIKGYPMSEVDRIYENYYYQFNLEYAQAAQLGYNGIDEYISVKLGLEDGADWTSTVMDMIKTEIKEYLVCYSILRRENIVPNDEEFKAIYNRELLLDYEYAKGYGTTTAATIEEFEVEVLETYGEDVYNHIVYYHFVTSKLLEYANVINLSETNNT